MQGVPPHPAEAAAVAARIGIVLSRFVLVHARGQSRPPRRSVPPLRPSRSSSLCQTGGREFGSHRLRRRCRLRQWLVVEPAAVQKNPGTRFFAQGDFGRLAPQRCARRVRESPQRAAASRKLQRHHDVPPRGAPCRACPFPRSRSQPPYPRRAFGSPGPQHFLLAIPVLRRALEWSRCSAPSVQLPPARSRKPSRVLRFRSRAPQEFFITR